MGEFRLARRATLTRKKKPRRGERARLDEGLPDRGRAFEGLPLVVALRTLHAKHEGQNRYERQRPRDHAEQSEEQILLTCHSGYFSGRRRRVQRRLLIGRPETEHYEQSRD